MYRLTYSLDSIYEENKLLKILQAFEWYKWDKRTVTNDITSINFKLSPSHQLKDAIKLAITNSNLLTLLNNSMSDKIEPPKDG